MVDKEKSEMSFFLEKKRTLFQQYLIISEELRKNYNGEDIETITPFIRERAMCIKKIEENDQALKRIKRRRESGLNQPKDKMPSHLAGTINNIKVSMDDVIAIDREMMSLLKEECDALRGDILEARRARQAARGYKGGAINSPRFLDKRS